MAEQYGALERRIARLLSRYPRLKTGIKAAYARLSYCLSGGRDGAAITQRPTRPVGPDGVETFFGYYDKSPLSGAGWLLCHAATHATRRLPSPERPVTVQVYNFKAGELTTPMLEIETRAYNWQQGARAHWLDDDHFIFNDYDAGERRYVSRVYCAGTGEETRRYAMPVQDSWRRAYFLAIDYRRIQALRPDYGYRNLPPLDDAALSRHEDDGIWRVEQDSGKASLLYSLRDICQVEPQEGFADARHKVNHVMIGPDGRHFIFLHRYFAGRRKSDRLMLGTADGAPLRVLSAHGMVSHCYWMNETALLCYLRGPEGRDGYYIVDTRTGALAPLLDGKLDAMGDGHPHVHGERFVTDTYPDRRRMQHLVHGDLRSGTTMELGRFHHGFRYGGETRCDLHPRISPDGNWVFFDSVCLGARRLHFLELGTP